MDLINDLYSTSMILYFLSELSVLGLHKGFA